MNTLWNKLCGAKEWWLNKTAVLRKKLRRLSRRHEMIGRAIMASKAMLFYDMFMMTERGGIETLGVGDNSRNPLYHDAERSEYLGRIIYANKAAMLNGELPERVSRRNPKGQVLYPQFAEHRSNTPNIQEEERELMAGM